MRKRQAAEELLIKMRQQGAAMTANELFRITGLTRWQLGSLLIWLEDCRAVTMTVDRGHKRWTAVPMDADGL